MRRDASLGLCDLMLQSGEGALRTAVAHDLTNGKPGSFQGLQSIAVLFQLNFMPSDPAVAVTTHERASLIRCTRIIA